MKPASAVEVWTEGELLWMQLPDQQAINIPINEPRRLISVLQAREAAIMRGQSRFNGMGVGTESAPCQLQIYDAFKEATRKQAKEEREKRARIKRADKAWEKKNALDFLKRVGLA